MKIGKWCVVFVGWLMMAPVQANAIRKYYQYRDSVVITDSLTVVRITQDSLLTKKQKDSLLRLPLDVRGLLLQLEENKPDYSYISVNDLFLKASPFFYELNFNGYHSVLDTFKLAPTDFRTQELKNQLFPHYFKPVETFVVERNVVEARSTLIRHFAVYHPSRIAYRVDKLPDVKDLINFQLEVKPVQKVIQLVKPEIKPDVKKIQLEKIKQSYWSRQATAMLQFSQNYISNNWHQGGNNNIAILGGVNGRFNYDNKKNLQWENFAEWRLGFNSVEGDTTRFLNTSDDVIRATSKLGIKAGGNWFYSANMDFSTNFFNSYRGVNSMQVKATLLTPVRFNFGVGMDYKYKKLLSLYVSPLTYKMVYANDTLKVNQNSFGIPKGEKMLQQFGSSFTVRNSLSPSREIQIDSKLYFYTNYEKVEIDWEIVGNFTVNRFLTTRLLINPRYDNTVILAKGEKAKLQLKELLTFGLSYRLL